jgi:hypothetical protein
VNIMTDDWKARLADIFKKIEQERVRVAAKKQGDKPTNVATLARLFDPSGRLPGGVNYQGDNE